MSVRLIVMQCPNEHVWTADIDALTSSDYFCPKCRQLGRRAHTPAKPAERHAEAQLRLFDITADTPAPVDPPAVAAHPETKRTGKLHTFTQNGGAVA